MISNTEIDRRLTFMDRSTQYIYGQNFKAREIEKMIAILKNQEYDSDALSADVPRYFSNVEGADDSNIFNMIQNSKLFRAVQRFCYYEIRM